MAIFKIFSGKDPQSYERKGDILFREGNFGDAKIAYEAGLYKLERRDPDNTNLQRRLEGKISKSKEALALYHKQKGEEILDSEYFDDAADLFRLALELTENEELRKELKALLKKAQTHRSKDRQESPHDFQPGNSQEGYDEGGASDEDEYFLALCGAISDRTREKAYHNYGRAFKEGYLALNRGDFELAAARLEKALEEDLSTKSYILFELATAYLNLGRTGEAENLLVSFLESYPDFPEGYQMLCETFWAQKEFNRALDLLNNFPGDLNSHPELILYKGETLAQSDRSEDAEKVFLDYLESAGWDENVAVSLARVYEVLNEKEKALDWYSKVMGTCTSCGTKPPPAVKRKYADISIECGHFSMDILEIYLSLVQEDPGNRNYYYSRVSEIYSKLGYEGEAERFRSFADESE